MPTVPRGDAEIAYSQHGTGPALVLVHGTGANGTTTTDRNAYGATPGAAGTQAVITASQIPGVGSGASCTSDLTIAKSHTDPFVRGSTGIYSLTVRNIGGTATSGTSTVTDTLPAGLTPTAASGAGWSCGIVAQTTVIERTSAMIHPRLGAVRALHQRMASDPMA